MTAESPFSAAPSSEPTAQPFTLPAPVGAVLSRLPAWPGAAALAMGLNRVLAPHLPADVLALLRGRHLRIAVRDARVAFDFGWDGQRFAPLHATPVAPDLTIRASAQDFLWLAQRKQDPATLFFCRRLAMEGDTELGLAVKNALDALDTPVLDPRQWLQPGGALRRLAPRAVLGALARRVGRGAQP